MCILNSSVRFKLITSYLLQDEYREWIISFFFVTAILYLKSAFMSPLAFVFKLNNLNLRSVILYRLHA